MDSNITLQTKQMIDSLKAVCTNFGLGNASSEYKIITEVIEYGNHWLCQWRHPVKALSIERSEPQVEHKSPVYGL